MKILTYIIMTISIFYNSFNRVFPVVPKVIKFLLLDTMEKSQIFTFFHIFCEILSDGFLKSTSSLFCVNTHQMIFLKIILKSMIFFLYHHPSKFGILTSSYVYHFIYLFRKSKYYPFLFIYDT